MRSVTLPLMASALVSFSALAEVPLAQIHIQNTGSYDVLREPIQSCGRMNLQLRSIKVVSGGELKANMVTVHFAEGDTQGASLYKDTYGAEIVADVYFDRPRCVESISLRARSKTSHGGTLVYISGEEARGGWDRPHRPGGWDRPAPPAPAPYQPPYNPPAPVEKRATEVVFSSQNHCGDLRQTVYVRHNEREQQQLCAAAAAQAGGRIMRTALVKFNDGSQSCENFGDGDLASVCMNVMRTVR